MDVALAPDRLTLMGPRESWRIRGDHRSEKVRCLWLIICRWFRIQWPGTRPLQELEIRNYRNFTQKFLTDVRDMSSYKLFNSPTYRYRRNRAILLCRILGHLFNKICLTPFVPSEENNYLLISIYKMFPHSGTLLQDIFFAAEILRGITTPLWDRFRFCVKFWVRRNCFRGHWSHGIRNLWWSRLISYYEVLLIRVFESVLSITCDFWT